MAFDYEAYKTQWLTACKKLRIDPATGPSTYQACNIVAERAKRQHKALATQRGNWWMHIDWLEWLDEPSHESRPTERVALILMSNEYRRAMERLDRWWVINTLRFAYDKAHELPLGALLNSRGLKLVFVEVGRKGSGKYKSVEVAA